MYNRLIKFKFLFLFTFIFCFSVLFSNQIDNRITKHGTLGLTGEKYITGDDGVARIAVNIWGHVKTPGTYLIYDGVDILTCLSLAGGPLKGANLKKVSILSIDGSEKKINLNKLTKDRQLYRIDINPSDTILIEEKLASYFLSRSNLISTLLQVLNLILVIQNNN